MENNFVSSFFEIFGGGQVMFMTNPEKVRDSASFMASCCTGKDLMAHGKRLAEMGLSDHDRRLLGAMYKVKMQIIQEMGNREYHEKEPVR